MNLKQLKYVLVLSREGSFSRAAEVLGISQPSLSQYIRNIEKQVGTPLFERLNTEVRLTDAGRIYIDAGKKILDLEHQMENRLSELAEYRGGTIRVGISPYRSVHMMPRVLKAFDRLYPDMQLVVIEKSGHDLIDAAEHGEFDLCVIALPVDDKLFSVVPIRREEILIAVDRSTDFCRRLTENAKPMEHRSFPAVDLKLAEHQPFAMLSEFMPMRNATDELLRRYGVAVRQKVEVSSNEALLSVVSSGVCASFVPSGLTGPGSDSGQTALFSLVQETAMRDVAVIWRRELVPTKPILDLIEIFRA